jgi:hypothetical protein
MGEVNSFYYMVCATEYTESGNGRFLAYIPSMMEKSALAVEGGGVHATEIDTLE